MPLAFSPDGAMLATGYISSGYVGTYVDIWEVATGRLRTTLKHAGCADWARFSPGGHCVAVPGFDRTSRSNVVTVLDIATGRELARIDVQQLGVCDMRYSADGESLVMILQERLDQQNARWFYKTWGTANWDEREQRLLPFTRSLKRPVLVVLSPDLKPMAVGADQGNAITLWDASTGAPTTTLGRPRLPPLNWPIRVSMDRSTLAVARADRATELWDLRTRTLRATLRPPSQKFGVRVPSIADDLGTMVSATGRSVGPPQTIAEQVEHVLRWVAGRGPQRAEVQLTVWDVAELRPRYVIKGENSPLLSPNGRVLATLDDSVIMLRDIPEN